MPSLRARLINALLRLTVKSMWRPGLEVAAVRAHAARSDTRLAPRAPAAPIESVEVAGRPARWFGAPELAERNGTLLYLHGGAWCLHLPAVYAAFCATLSNATGLRVLLPEYRLAPEHPFPAAIDDCLAIYHALLARPMDRPVSIAGDSAGGSLTLVTLMRARDANLSLPQCAVLLSPSTDLTFTGPSIRYNAAADPMFSTASMDLLPDIYCSRHERAHPLLSPLFGDWSGLPPLYFVAGSTEMLLDDSVRAHDRALQAGVQSRIDVDWCLPHVFPVMGLLPEARVAVRRIAEFIAEHRRLETSLPATGPIETSEMQALDRMEVTAERADRPSA